MRNCILKIVFVCNKYSPAHFYTIESYCYIFSQFKIDCFLLGDFLNSNEKYDLLNIDIISSKSLRKCKDKIVFFFVSPNTNNIKTVKLIEKSFPKAKTVYLYHEPMNKAVKKGLIKDRGFSFKTIKYIFGLSYFNGRPLLKHFDYVILPSKNANTIFESDKSLKKKRHSIIHLLFKSNPQKKLGKKYSLSYIGTAANNHGFAEFIQFLLSKHYSNSDKVLIATSSKLDTKIIEQLNSKFGNNIEIHHGSFMSDGEISQYYIQTKVLWLGYKHSAQSGVLPMSFMYGVPVVCSNIDAFSEFAEEGINCEFININDCSSVSESIHRIWNSYEKYENGCLETYNKFFNPEFNKELVIETFNNICENN